MHDTKHQRYGSIGHGILDAVSYPRDLIAIFGQAELIC
jgi:hypothetical protein